MKTTAATATGDLAAIVLRSGSARRSRLRWIVLLCVVLTGIAVSRLFSRAHSDAGPQYVSAPLERGNLTLTVTATGNLEPTNEVTVGCELSGTAAEVLVTTNDHIAKGQPLARLDTRKLLQQTASSRAVLVSAQAKVMQAKATVVEKAAAIARVHLLQELSHGREPSKADVETAIAAAERAKADLASAEAAVDESRAQLEANETDLTKATITAPIDGTLLKRKLEPGQTVAAAFNTPELFVIAENLQRMKLKVSVSEADIGSVQAGQSASFTVDAWPDRSYRAKVTKTAYGSTVTDNVVTYETELEVSNEDLSLRPGMTATVEIRTHEAAGVLLVPSAAFRFEPEAAGPAGSPGAPASSFLQRIMPGPPPGMPRPRTEDAPKSKPSANPRLWTLHQGKPTPLPVKTGLSNGRVTVVSGDGLVEGMPVLLRTAASLP